MFDDFENAPPDAILGLTEAFKRDPNPDKINLSVGVYKDSEGRTPILACVKDAESQLLANEKSKGYLAIDGLPEYGAQSRRLLFGDDHELAESDRAVSLQTPGGTGALRVAADLLKRKLPDARIWHSQPTWANHPSILAAADRVVDTYAYLNDSGTGLDFPAMLADLQQIPAGDVVLLHACCHNPTGVDPTADQWKQIAEVVQSRKLLPLVDFAYQGFGSGLSEDSTGLLELSRTCREMLICSSFSKNFGLYGERVGALTIVADSATAAQAALSHAKLCVRANYSNPPQHGGSIVATVLGDDALRKKWEQELEAMRSRINEVRQQFVATMSKQASGTDFSFIAEQRGMFSFSGLTPLQVDELKKKHSIYIVTAGGRINVAGITKGNIDRVCAAIASVL
jgi:aspartate aminotransferase